MSYTEQLNQASEVSYESRAEEISQDVSAAFNDDTIFSELIANSVGEAIAQAIEKSGLDAFVNDSIDGAKSLMAGAVQEAVHGAINSEKFTVEFAEALAQKEVDRELDDFHRNDNHLDDREMEP